MKTYTALKSCFLTVKLNFLILVLSSICFCHNPFVVDIKSDSVLIRKHINAHILWNFLKLKIKK